MRAIGRCRQEKVSTDWTSVNASMPDQIGVGDELSYERRAPMLSGTVTSPLHLTYPPMTRLVNSSLAGQVEHRASHLCERPASIVQRFGPIGVYALENSRKTSEV